jgi:hypothetical protein
MSVFAQPRELAYHAIVHHVLLMDHSARIISEKATLHAIQYHLGYGQLAFRWLAPGFIVDVLGHALQLAFTVLDCDELVRCGFFFDPEITELVICYQAHGGQSNQGGQCENNMSHIFYHRFILLWLNA